MSRKGQTRVRNIKPDTKYGSVVIGKIINYAMKDGRKTASVKQVYQGLETYQKQVNGENLITSLEQALDNIKPRIEVRPRRIGGAVYQVPTPIRSHRQLSLAIRWLISSARKRANKQYHDFSQKLSAELTDALNNAGAAVTKKNEIEKMAEANKAFSHLKW